MFTDKYTKKNLPAKPCGVKHYENGGLVDEDGNAPTMFSREIGTKEHWDRKREQQKQTAADKDAEGTRNRSMGEHLEAAARAMFEGGKHRERAVADGLRDPKNTLYNRRKGKVED